MKCKIKVKLESRWDYDQAITACIAQSSLQGPSSTYLQRDLYLDVPITFQLRKAGNTVVRIRATSELGGSHQSVHANANQTGQNARVVLSMIDLEHKKDHKEHKNEEMEVKQMEHMETEEINLKSKGANLFKQLGARTDIPIDVSIFSNMAAKVNHPINYPTNIQQLDELLVKYRINQLFIVESLTTIRTSINLGWTTVEIDKFSMKYEDYFQLQFEKPTDDSQIKPFLEKLENAGITFKLSNVPKWAYVFDLDVNDFNQVPAFKCCGGNESGECCLHHMQAVTTPPSLTPNDSSITSSNSYSAPSGNLITGFEVNAQIHTPNALFPSQDYQKNSLVSINTSSFGGFPASHVFDMEDIDQYYDFSGNPNIHVNYGNQSQPQISGNHQNIIHHHNQDVLSSDNNHEKEMTEAKMLNTMLTFQNEKFVFEEGNHQNKSRGLIAATAQKSTLSYDPSKTGIFLVDDIEKMPRFLGNHIAISNPGENDSETMTTTKNLKQGKQRPIKISRATKNMKNLPEPSQPQTKAVAEALGDNKPLRQISPMNFNSPSPTPSSPGNSVSGKLSAETPNLLPLKPASPNMSNLTYQVSSQYANLPFSMPAGLVGISMMANNSQDNLDPQALQKKRSCEASARYRRKKQKEEEETKIELDQYKAHNQMLMQQIATLQEKIRSLETNNMVLQAKLDVYEKKT